MTVPPSRLRGDCLAIPRRGLADTFLFLALLAFPPSPAHASGGSIFLSWNDCGAAGQADMPDGCFANEGWVELHGAFQLDQFADDYSRGMKKKLRELVGSYTARF